MIIGTLSAIGIPGFSLMTFVAAIAGAVFALHIVQLFIGSRTNTQHRHWLEDRIGLPVDCLFGARWLTLDG